MKKLTFVFVHGAGGWGHYDAVNRFLPYWGMFTGDLMKYLRSRGYDCHAASVTPNGSVWVRACELYAQLAGCRTDYGRAFSEKEGCPRYGRDFTGEPLIPQWNEDTRLVLIGHSMGGITVRLLAHLLAYGSRKEQDCTAGDDLSPLFAGGMADRVHTILTLASPHNGASSLDMVNDSAFDLEHVRIPLWSRVTLRLLSLRMNPGKRTRDVQRSGKKVSNIDRALAQNREIETLDSVYYFSLACSSTDRQADGTYRPSPAKTEILYYARAVQIGVYSGVTPEGFVIDEAWRQNDGLVNTVSALAPLGAPQKSFDREHVEKGIWHVFPVYDGDHMSVQGGFFHRRDVRAFYLDLLQMISRLE